MGAGQGVAVLGRALAAIEHTRELPIANCSSAALALAALREAAAYVGAAGDVEKWRKGIDKLALHEYGEGAAQIVQAAEAKL
eukprot:11829391-Karenia_brevis.AAC.1